MTGLPYLMTKVNLQEPSAHLPAATHVNGSAVSASNSDFHALLRAADEISGTRDGAKHQLETSRGADQLTRRRKPLHVSGFLEGVLVGRRSRPTLREREFLGQGKCRLQFLDSKSGESSFHFSHPSGTPQDRWARALRPAFEEKFV